MNRNCFTKVIFLLLPMMSLWSLPQQEPVSRLGHLTIRSLTIDPQNANHFFAGTLNVNNSLSLLYHSVDGGKSWQVLNSGRPISQGVIQAIEIAPDSFHEESEQENRSIFVGTVKGLYQSKDMGKTFLKIDSFDQGVTAIKFSPKNAGHIYVGTQSGVMLSEDKGATWSSEKKKVDVWSLAVHEDDLYANTYSGFYKRKDKKKWKKIWSESHQGCFGAAFENPNKIYLATGNFTMNQGAVYSLIKEKRRKKLTKVNVGTGIAQNNQKDVFVGTWGQGVLYKRKDQSSWEQLPGTEGRQIMHVRCAEEKVIIGCMPSKATPGGILVIQLADAETN